MGDPLWGPAVDDLMDEAMRVTSTMMVTGTRIEVDGLQVHIISGIRDMGGGLHSLRVRPTLSYTQARAFMRDAVPWPAHVTTVRRLSPQVADSFTEITFCHTSAKTAYCDEELAERVQKKVKERYG